MPDEFNKILIPFDFSVNTEIAVRKAIGFATGGDAVIHLLHVAGPRRSAEGKYEITIAEQKMEEWRSFILENSSQAMVKMHILMGHSVQKMILECAAMLRPGLIIIGKRKKDRRWPFFPTVSPNYVAQESKCPVLTAKPGSILACTRLILIPIGNIFPKRKLELDILPAKKYNVQVHLLAQRRKAVSFPLHGKGILVIGCPGIRRFRSWIFSHTRPNYRKLMRYVNEKENYHLRLGFGWPKTVYTLLRPN